MLQTEEMAAIVQAALERGIEVVPVPGPAACPASRGDGRLLHANVPDVVAVGVTEVGEALGELGMGLAEGLGQGVPVPEDRRVVLSVSPPSSSGRSRPR